MRKIGRLETGGIRLSTPDILNQTRDRCMEVMQSPVYSSSSYALAAFSMEQRTCIIPNSSMRSCRVDWHIARPVSSSSSSKLKDFKKIVKAAVSKVYQVLHISDCESWVESIAVLRIYEKYASFLP